MITCALLDMLTALLSSLYTILPDWSLDIGATSGAGGGNIVDLQYTVTSGSDPLTMILLWMQKYNNFVPFDQLVIIVTTFAGFVTAVVAYKVIRFIIGVVRGAGTS